MELLRGTLLTIDLEVRSLFSRVEPYVLLMRAAGLVAMVLAVFRPVLP